MPQTFGLLGPQKQSLDCNSIERIYGRPAVYRLVNISNKTLSLGAGTIMGAISVKGERPPNLNNWPLVRTNSLRHKEWVSDTWEGCYSPKYQKKLDEQAADRTDDEPWKQPSLSPTQLLTADGRLRPVYLVDKDKINRPESSRLQDRKTDCEKTNHGNAHHENTDCERAHDGKTDSEETHNGKRLCENQSWETRL